MGFKLLGDLITSSEGAWYWDATQPPLSLFWDEIYRIHADYVRMMVRVVRRGGDWDSYEMPINDHGQVIGLLDWFRNHLQAGRRPISEATSPDFAAVTADLTAWTPATDPG